MDSPPVDRVIVLDIFRTFKGNISGFFARLEWRWDADTYEENVRCAGMESEMAKAVAACGRYRAEKGAWPGRLEDLLPGYLKEILRDIFSEGGEKGVGYMWSDAGVTLRSLGRKPDARGERKEAIEVGLR